MLIFYAVRMGYFMERRAEALIKSFADDCMRKKPVRILKQIEYNNLFSYSTQLCKGLPLECGPNIYGKRYL